MKKRILSILLALSMLPSLMPTAVYAADIEELMNTAPLNPVRNELYGERVDEILVECGYGEEDTYTVFKNCYDWLINNVRYRTDDDFLDSRSLTFSVNMDQRAINARAYGPFYQGIGVCDEYAGALYVLAQAIGLKPYYCRGETRKRGGGYIVHAWMGVELNEQLYLFDPQVEDDVARGGAIQYYYFGKTFEELGGSHILNEESFELFKKESGYLDSEGETAVYDTEIPLYNDDSETNLTDMEEIRVSEEEEQTADTEEVQGIEDTEQASEGIRVTVDGKQILFDQPPLIVNDRTMVPLRVIFEAMGASVSWDQNTKMILAEKEGTLVVLQLDHTELYKNGIAVTLDVPAMMVNERVLVPTRAVAETFGCDVTWNEAEQMVEIESEVSAVF